jgi:hypothetical protein
MFKPARSTTSIRWRLGPCCLIPILLLFFVFQNTIGCAPSFLWLRISPRPILVHHTGPWGSRCSLSWAARVPPTADQDNSIDAGHDDLSVPALRVGAQPVLHRDNLATCHNGCCQRRPPDRRHSPKPVRGRGER